MGTFKNQLSTRFLHPDFTSDPQAWSQAIDAAQEILAHNPPECGFVVVAEPNPINYAATVLTGIRGGHSLILANPRWGEREWQALFEQCTPQAIVGIQPETFPQKEPESIPTPLKGSLSIPTGGTTGTLKLSVHTLETLAASVEGMQRFFQLEQIHSLCLLPLHHVSGLMQLIRAALSQGSIAFSTAQTWLEDIAKLPDDRAWQTSLVPTLLERALTEPSAGTCLKTFEHIFLGGARTSEASIQKALKHPLPIVLTYGMTETASMVAAIRTEHAQSTHASLLPHANAKIIEREIILQAQSLHLGYLHEWLFEQRSSPPSSHATGDLGELKTSGLKVFGRKDRLINSGGEKISPDEVEQCLLCHPAVKHARIYPQPERAWGEAVACLIVPQDDHTLDVETLKQYLQKSLAPHKIPKIWNFSKALPDKLK